AKAAATAHAAFEGLVPIAVVGGPFVGVAQHFVGFVGVLEIVLGFGVPRIAVRMKLHRLLPERLLDFGIPGSPGNTENLVIITFGHWLPSTLASHAPLPLVCQPDAPTNEGGARSPPRRSPAIVSY